MGLGVALLSQARAKVHVDDICQPVKTRDECEDQDHDRCKWSATDPDNNEEGVCSVVCLDANYKYKPYLKDSKQTKEPSVWTCQDRCEKTDGCKHFSYWWDKGCRLAGEDAERHKSEGVMSGLPGCTSCYLRNFAYKPYMGSRTLVKSPQECQERCQKEDKCEYFSWWSDHGCKLAGKGAELKTSSKPPVSGPRNCAVRSKPASVTPPKPEEEERQKVEEERRRKDAEAKKKQQEEEDAARKKKDEEERTIKKQGEEETALKKKEDEAAREKKEEEEASRKKKEEEDATRKKKEDEAARKNKEEEEA